MITTRNADTTVSTTTSQIARASGDMRLISAVSRMCSLRRIASTAPSTHSQTNRIEASSSPHTSGRLNT